MYRILIADDEKDIRAIVSKYAVFEGHEVIEAENGMEAVRLFRSEKPDIAVIDIMMPELDGFSACREIRKFSDAPLIILSARGEEYDKINGFEAGVDDYVVKPFSPKELMMRIDAVMRRAEGRKEAPDTDDSQETHVVFAVGGLKVDFSARIVYTDGEECILTPKEYELLYCLIKNRNIALSRETLITKVWGYDYYGDDRTLDTHIKMLRRSLGKYASHIVTLRGMGYRFDTNAKPE